MLSKGLAKAPPSTGANNASQLAQSTEPDWTDCSSNTSEDSDMSSLGFGEDGILHLYTGNLSDITDVDSDDYSVKHTEEQIEALRTRLRLVEFEKETALEEFQDNESCKAYDRVQ